MRRLRFSLTRAAFLTAASSFLLYRGARWARAALLSLPRRGCARLVCGDEQIDAASIKRLFAFASDAGGRSGEAAHLDEEAYSRVVVDSNVEFNGPYDARDKPIKHLFDWLGSLDAAMLQRFLRWLTGHNAIPPLNPARPFRLLVDGKTLTELGALPSVSTCYNQLHLPPYETFIALEQKLTMAVQEGASASFELR